MLEKILCANDGSAPAFKALEFALALAKEHRSEVHMVSVAEIDYLPEFVEEIRQEEGAAMRRFRSVTQRAREMAEKSQIELQIHIRTGHPVRDVVKIAAELRADLLVIGATGHSALYERMIGSRADRIVQLAGCPVLVVK